MGPLGCHDIAIPSWSILDQRIPLAGVAHQCGTVRFGTDPAESALDVNCKAHDVDNLYVVDTSFFPSSGAVNPALTAMANALRVGDHLLERLGARIGADAKANGKLERDQTQTLAPHATITEDVA
jgi:choline dehydrogenase-like flavoprotein